MLSGASTAGGDGSFDPRSLTDKTTGVPADQPLEQVTGGLTIDRAGMIVENKTFDGRVTIAASNVTLRNCAIKGDAYYAVLIDDRNGPLTGVIVENCTIAGSTNGIAGSGTFRRNNISACDNGCNLWGPCDIIENYIHDFASNNPDPHFDGIENNGCSNVNILRTESK